MGDVKTRLGGLFLMLMGGGFTWYFLYKPLQDAANHVANLSYTTKGVILGPILILAGLGMVVFGDTLKPLLQKPGGNRKQLTPLGWVLTLLVAAVGIGIMIWFENQIKGYGYNTSG